MTPSLKDLLPPDQQPLTAQLHEPVLEAIDRLRAHEYNQLPVVDDQGRCRGEVVTHETILHAVQAFDVKPTELRVKDAIKQVKTYDAEDDLLTTLDVIQRNDFALIVGEDDKLIGIVTTADTTAYFHKYAGDLMMIEGVEESVKEAIEILYGGLHSQELTEAIETVTDRAAETRKKLPGAIRAYLNKVGLSSPPSTDDRDALAAAEASLKLQKAGKAFDRLNFDEFTEILLRHSKAPRVGDTTGVESLRKILNTVRDARNKLAHFRGDVTAKERADIKLAAGWLERHQPVKPAILEQTPSSVPAVEKEPAEQLKPSTEFDIVIANPPYENKGEEDSAPQGKYAALSVHLAELPNTVQTCIMPFEEIERLLNEKLPSSAYQYRAWWANDPSKPQAAAWLAQGWKAQSLSMSEKRLMFVRTDDRQQAYIAFFSRVNAKLVDTEGFPHRNLSPQGQNWHTLASIEADGIVTANIVGAFVRQGRFRIELYLDGPTAQSVKNCFGRLQENRADIEQQFGEPLSWERLEERRASRVAIYREASILTDSDNEDAIQWAAKRAVDLYRVFGNEFARLREENLRFIEEKILHE